MATQEETKQAVEDSLKRIGRESRIVFDEFSTETYTQGGYSSGTWTYKFTPRRISFEYWFSSFSNRKDEAEITYQTDDDKEKLESDLKEALGRLRQIVNRKKGIF